MKPKHRGRGANRPNPHTPRMQQVVELLRTYYPMGLTYDDVAEELGISRKNAQYLAWYLADAGRIRKDTQGRGANRTTNLYALEGPE